MPFHLETDGMFTVSDATEADICRAFDDDELRGEYVILTDPAGNFMQAAGDGDGPYILEHRTAQTREHIQSVGEYSKEQIRSAFLAYLRGDERWRGEFKWQPSSLTPAPPQGEIGVCERCGEHAPGRRKWMFYSYWIDRAFYCFDCLRVMRIYSIIGGVIAAVVIAVALGAWLWLTFF